MRTPIYIFIIIFITNLFIPSFLNAQDNYREKGNRHYLNQEYALAIKYFKRHLETTTDLCTKVKLAKCHELTQNIEKAELLYSEIVGNPDALPIYFKDYAQLLKQAHKYNEAKEWFKRYAELHPEDQEISSLIISCNLINELHDDSVYIVKPVSINSPQSDFASAFYQNGIIFLSGRPNKTSSSISPQTGEHYLDLYYSRKEGNNYSNPIALSEGFNSRINEGPACFSKNQKFIYFTRNKKSINPSGQSELSIYTAHFNGTFWDKPERFQFDGFSFSLGHPCLSSDGRTLFFISNMSGGYGGTDIYVCYKQGFNWSLPINLGPTINTPQDEKFPFIAEDGYLYFASEGHIGFGGLDIFKSMFDQNQWSHPINLGPPFNSPKNDFAFFIDTNGEKGYFSSNRDGGMGSDDIYEFTKDMEKMIPLTGRISHRDSKKAISEVEVTLMSGLYREGTTHTDMNGVFNFNITPHKNYSFIIQKPGFKTKRILYFSEHRTTATNHQINIMADSEQWVIFKGKVTDESNSHALKDATIQLINKVYRVNQIVQTDKEGNFAMEIDPEKPYDMIISREGYFTQVIKKFRYQDGIPKTIQLQNISRNLKIELTKALFEEGRWELLQSTKKELDTIAEMMINNPNIMIQIGAYTHKDTGRKSNQQLCSMRAMSAANYITTKGIPLNRIKTKSLGHSTDNPVMIIRVIEPLIQ